ncbi:hypothetical protein [Tomitella cavernea]|uniref:Secreted protein n=1 Tax=Tomitella cavernea TaxID=1387982 RepID=A0ABP9D5N7_9ACTN|nr:hypothetical protein [Tomitella cavernea]
MPRARHAIHALTAVATATITAIVLAAAAGTATAAPPPGLALAGTQLTLAPDGACWGNILVGLDQTPHSGNLTVTLTPAGTWGTPGCPADVEVSTISGAGPQNRLVRVDGGPTSTTFDIGYGFAMVNVDSLAPAGWNAGYHIVMVP